MTTTQADSAAALGTPPDRVESPALGHGDTATHDMINLHPGEVRSGDIYRYQGQYFTVHQVLELAEGGVAYYFVELVHGALARAVIPEGTMGVTVYRPKSSIADA